jgi:hypothetical protein
MLSARFRLAQPRSRQAHALPVHRRSGIPGAKGHPATSPPAPAVVRSPRLSPQVCVLVPPAMSRATLLRSCPGWVRC